MWTLHFITNISTCVCIHKYFGAKLIYLYSLQYTELWRHIFGWDSWERQVYPPNTKLAHRYSSMKLQYFYTCKEKQEGGNACCVRMEEQTMGGNLWDKWGLQLALGSTRGRRPFKGVTGISRCFSKRARRIWWEFIKRATDIKSECNGGGLSKKRLASCSSFASSSVEVFQ